MGRISNQTRTLHPLFWNRFFFGNRDGAWADGEITLWCCDVGIKTWENSVSPLEPDLHAAAQHANNALRGLACPPSDYMLLRDAGAQVDGAFHRLQLAAQDAGLAAKYSVLGYYTLTRLLSSDMIKERADQASIGALQQAWQELVDASDRLTEAEKRVFHL